MILDWGKTANSKLDMAEMTHKQLKKEKHRVLLHSRILPTQLMWAYVKRQGLRQLAPGIEFEVIEQQDTHTFDDALGSDSDESSDGEAVVHFGGRDDGQRNEDEVGQVGDVCVYCSTDLSTPIC